MKAGSFKHWCYQIAAWGAVRTPFVSASLRPRYDYALRPAQLAWLCDAIEKTAGTGCIVEVGVARGRTTRLLLEHMKDLGDTRPYYCIDTFSGFVRSDVDVEVAQRGKKRRAFIGYRYNSAEWFRRAFQAFKNVRVIEADATKVDWSTLQPIAVLLLDVDLYAPTVAVLKATENRLVPNALVMVDDVKIGGAYDGALQAYQEYCTERAIVPVIVGSKGGVLGQA